VYLSIWVQGVLAGEPLRKSLDLTNWEAATRLTRDSKLSGDSRFPPVGKQRGICREIYDLVEVGSKGVSGNLS
jgi:hypothetical protein